jgi:O-antigen/teichoic acid export membrane protein
MFTSIYIARILKPNAYGYYGVILSIVAILQVLSGLGLSATITRKVARNQGKSLAIFLTSLRSYGLGFAATSILFLLYYLCFKNDLTFQLFILIEINLLSLNGWTMIQNVAFGMERMESNGLINLIFTIILLLSYLIIPHTLISVYFVFSISIVIQLIKVITYYFICKKEKNFTGEPSNKNARIESVQLIKISIPFLVMASFSMFSNQLPILFLNSNSGASQVAFYNTANKLLLPITLVITTLMTAIYPNLSKIYLANKSEYSSRIKIIFKSISVIGISGAIFVILFRNEIVKIIYGTAYIQTGNVMAYQSIFMVVFALFCFIGNIFSSSDHQKLLSKLSIAYAVISVPILWYGSSFGAESLSIAFVIAAILNFTYHWYFLQKILPVPFEKRFTLNLLILFSIPFLLLFLNVKDISIQFRLLILVSLLGGMYFFNYKTITNIISIKQLH